MLKHPELEDDSPFAHPNAWQDWMIRKSDQIVPYDVVVFCKSAQDGYTRLFVEHHAEFAAHAQPSGYVFFRLDDGRFALITGDMTDLVELSPSVDIWNWWDEGCYDLESIREKQQLDLEIKQVRYN